ncbi:hypothetical protein [Rhodopseudomonas sp. B29]|uniref:hypothetical protein n=1 Tax=Rhodopseudomonas sp. B29 TaxID=95607 RepID=UPI000348353A|nr:hypothetical protein [Rhodopseudomonas sp. B29]
MHQFEEPLSPSDIAKLTFNFFRKVPVIAAVTLGTVAAVAAETSCSQPCHEKFCQHPDGITLTPAPNPR